MPELPEVETVARQLEPELEGHTVEVLEVRDQRWSRPVAAKTLGKKVTGRTILGLGRRGKYLLLGLDGDQTLVMHLRMTGNLVLREDDGEILDPSEGRTLYQGERTSEERYLRAQRGFARERCPEHARSVPFAVANLPPRRGREETPRRT